jgi:hypothetical protein
MRRAFLILAVQPHECQPLIPFRKGMGPGKAAQPRVFVTGGRAPS